MNKNEIIVSICCLTFNHKDFISRAIEGFLVQKTNFNFEILIHDDASIDGTNKIVSDYAEKDERIIPIFQKSNQYSLSNKPWINFVFPKARGKYIAICDGDDFWTDPNKLQKQIDFLEMNQEYVMCTHNHSTLYEDSGEINKNEKFKENFTYGLNKYLNSQVTPTLTACFRNIFRDYKYLAKEKIFSDFFLFFELLKHGKGYFMVDNMATYRVHNQGVCSSLSREQYILNHIRMFKHLYKYNPWLRQLKSHIARYYLNHFNYLLRVEQKKRPNWGSFRNYMHYEINTKRFLGNLFYKLPMYLAFYWIRNILHFKWRH